MLKKAAGMILLSGSSLEIISLTKPVMVGSFRGAGRSLSVFPAPFPASKC